MHTVREPLLKTLRLLKLQDIYAIQQYRYIYKLLDLPSYFNSILISRNQDIT